PPPDEEGVIIDFIDLWGKPRKIRLSWDGLKPMLAPNAGQKSLATRFRRSIHMGAEAVRRAKKYRFNRALWKAETEPTHGRGKNQRLAAACGAILRAASATTQCRNSCY